MNRIASIDIFRALTMCLMIFVNDLFTIKNVPAWMLHTEMFEDGMGFSDIIFPVFLVIVGLSVPFAIQNRIKKGDSNKMLLFHILERTLALTAMGYLLVNYEYLKATEISFPKYYVGMYLVTCFFLIWNTYKHENQYAKYLKILGVFGLLVYVYFYPGKMSAHWWGILGLIGWSYLCVSVAYLVSRNNVYKSLAFVVVFIVLAILNGAGMLTFFDSVRKYIWIVESGALPFLSMLGVFAAVLYQNKTFKNYSLFLILAGLALIGLGFYLRNYFIISKMLATPSWVAICGGIAYIVYGILYYLVDVKGFSSWASILKPAGVATLTCYLIPYYWYGFRNITGIRLPSWAL